MFYLSFNLIQAVDASKAVKQGSFFICFYNLSNLLLFYEYFYDKTRISSNISSTNKRISYADLFFFDAKLLYCCALQNLSCNLKLRS